MNLTAAQWEKLKPLLAPKRRSDGRGRPWRDTQAVLNGVLWVLRTGAPWHDLPDRYPPYQTCHRRFQQWQRDGTLDRLLHALAEDLRTRGKLDLSETFIDASFSSAKKGAPAVGPTRRGKGSKIMAIADRHGLPVACCVTSASPHESKLVEATIAQRFTRAKPKRMIGDRAYDSDPLDQRLRQKHGIRLIAPHKYNRRRKNTQDGRELRRYCRRWKIERLFAWLHNFRRLVSRWEYHEANFLGMLQLGCLIILLRHL
ncbi:MAG TPA: IS5 family transposase [Candidatus Acidoferrales bacterium]|nr:IS5 family transposase [Candidatus Acidoferrales bacterium]